MTTLKNVILAFLTVCLLISCEQTENASQLEPPTVSQLEKIKDRGKLIVLTTNLPTTYYYDRDNQLAGPEYEMTQSFAKSLELDVEYKTYDSVNELLIALRNKEGDIAASGLTKNDRRSKDFEFGPVYQTTNEYLVCHRSKKRIRNQGDLKDTVVVVSAGTSYIDSLKDYPEILWSIDNESNTAALIEKAAKNKSKCTISDSTLYNIERRYHTEIQNKYTLAKQSELVWLFNKDSKKLKQAVFDWFDIYKTDLDLAYMLEKYYGHVQIFDYVDAHKFLRRVKTRLPEYEQYFIQAATENDISPVLLAAQSYQESHWNRKAKSPTGVRGIMMLTQPVAKSLGVTNRLHAKQNIFAGAKFQAKMKKMFTHVAEPDRTWLALAAYNIGRGHFRDAQSLARKLNKNPERWHDMKEVLPLLSEQKYCKDLKYGYARGNEPVRYVTRIRGYEELLHKHFKIK